MCFFHFFLSVSKASKVDYFCFFRNRFELIFIVVILGNFLLFSEVTIFCLKLALSILNFIQKTANNFLDIFDLFTVAWMAHIVEAINLGLLFSWNIELADVVAKSEAQFGKKDIDCFDEFSDGLDLAILTALIQVAGSNEQVKVRNELIALKTISF